MNSTEGDCGEPQLLALKLRQVRHELSDLIEFWYQSEGPYDDERQALASRAFDDVEHLQHLILEQATVR